jgi:hypothetical protein
MSTLKFPLPPESDHPQYLWNEQEYIIRMLTQNKIGIGVSEDNTYISLYLTPEKSTGSISKGPVNIVPVNTFAQFPTNTTQWIYVNSSNLTFYTSTKKPVWNNYLHGWYYSDQTLDRAVVFIDPNQIIGYRGIILDSFNAHYQYEHRIPDTGGTLVFDAHAINPNTGVDYVTVQTTLYLTPGSYRFEMKAGKGGNGGSSTQWNINSTTGLNNAAQWDEGGGAGVDGAAAVYKITIVDPLWVTLLCGGNGQNAVNGVFYENAAIQLTGYNFQYVCASGSGGSSGQDTAVLQNNRQLFRVLGGSGGGGSLSYYTNDGNYGVHSMQSGAGGGGGGHGHGAEGFYYKRTNTRSTSGKGGYDGSGGDGQWWGFYSPNESTYDYYLATDGEDGESVDSSIDTYIRKGGKAGYCYRNNIGGSRVDIYPGNPGTTPQKTTNGHLRIYRTAEVS